MTAGEGLLSAAGEMRAMVAESAWACSCSLDDCRENGCGISRRKAQRDSEIVRIANTLQARLEEARSAIAKQSPATRANLAGRFRVD